MKTIQFLGRLAVCLLATIAVEGVLTVGWAYKFEDYTALAWITQALIAVINVWAACEWFYYDKLAGKYCFYCITTMLTQVLIKHLMLRQH